MNSEKYTFQYKDIMVDLYIQNKKSHIVITYKDNKFLSEVVDINDNFYADILLMREHVQEYLDEDYDQIIQTFHDMEER